MPLMSASAASAASNPVAAPVVSRVRLGFGTTEAAPPPADYTQPPPPSFRSTFSGAQPPPSTADGGSFDNMSKEQLLAMLRDAERKKAEAEEEARRLQALAQAATARAPAAPAPMSDRLSAALNALKRGGGPPASSPATALSGLADWAAGSSSRPPPSGAAQYGAPRGPSQYSNAELDAMNAMLRTRQNQQPQGVLG